MPRNNKVSFNDSGFNEIKEQLKKAHVEAKEKYDNEKTSKQSLGNKVVAIIVLIAIMAVIVFVIILNFELLLMPKNSITIIVNDQNGDVIEGLRLYANSDNHSFTIEFDETSGSTVTELGVKPGNYILTFENIPENYNCNEITDEFTMSDGDKIKLEYECTKENE